VDQCFRMSDRLVMIPQINRDLKLWTKNFMIDGVIREKRVGRKILDTAGGNGSDSIRRKLCNYKLMDWWKGRTLFCFFVNSMKFECQLIGIHFGSSHRTGQGQSRDHV